MPIQDVVILGTGGNCVDIFDAIHAINATAGAARLRCIGFLDDDAAKHGTSILGVPVLGDAPIGHIPDNQPVLLGARVELDAVAGTLSWD